MNEDIRETIHSVEYDEYYASLDEKTKAMNTALSSSQLRLLRSWRVNVYSF